MFVPGGHTPTSTAAERFARGYKHGAFIGSQLELSEGETIKIVGHSHGAAHAAGLTQSLIDQGFGDRIELVTYIAPHQPTGINHPSGINGIQFSNLSDEVSSNFRNKSWSPISKFMNNVGPSRFGKINGITEFNKLQIYDATGNMGHLMPIFTKTVINHIQNVRVSKGNFRYKSVRFL